jgi:magnesium transporter
MLLLTSVDMDRVATARREGTFVWIDLVDPSPADVKRLGEALGLHPLAIEDTLEWGQRPKLDRYRDHALIVYLSAREAPGSERMFEPVELHIHLMPSAMVTVRRAAFPPLDELRDSLSPDDRHHGAWFVYRVLDTLTDAYYPVLSSIQERLDTLETDVLARPRESQLAVIYRLKQAVSMLYRRLEDQRNDFPEEGDELPLLGSAVRPYLRDIRDHLDQLIGELHRVTIDLTGLADTYFNANANRLNRTATRLTLIGSFFLAWTLVTGFFGQNFGWLVRHMASRTDFLVFGVGALVGSTILVAALLWGQRHERE